MLFTFIVILFSVGFVCILSFMSGVISIYFAEIIIEIFFIRFFIFLFVFFVKLIWNILILARYFWSDDIIRDTVLSNNNGVCDHDSIILLILFSCKTVKRQYDVENHTFFNVFFVFSINTKIHFSEFQPNSCSEIKGYFIF